MSPCRLDNLVGPVLVVELGQQNVIELGFQLLVYIVYDRGMGSTFQYFPNWSLYFGLLVEGLLVDCKDFEH